MSWDIFWSGTLYTTNICMYMCVIYIYTYIYIYIYIYEHICISAGSIFDISKYRDTDI